MIITQQSSKRLPSNLILLGHNLHHNSHLTTTSKNPTISLLLKIRKWQVSDGDVFQKILSTGVAGRIFYKKQSAFAEGVFQREITRTTIIII